MKIHYSAVYSLKHWVFTLSAYTYSKLPELMCIGFYNIKSILLQKPVTTAITSIGSWTVQSFITL